MKVELYTGPNVEPLTVAEAKAHLRVDHTTDDAHIESLIKAARLAAEKFQGRRYINQTYRYYLNWFPAAGYIELPYCPLSSVTSITYEDENGDTQTLATSRYQVDTKSEPGRVYLEPGTTWPRVEPDRINAVTITYVVGYGTTSASVPENVRHAIRLLVGDMYNHREDTVVGQQANELPMGVKSLLWQDRLYRF